LDLRSCERRKAWKVALFVSLLAVIRGTDRGVADPGSFSGYMFGDYYWVAASHDTSLENQNGFWSRRIYFTYDQGLSEEFSMRFRL